MPDRERSGLQKGDLIWRRPNRTSLSNLLRHPMYAGAYTYGRRLTDARKKKPGRPSTGRVVVKSSEWSVLIKDKVPAYISWEQYERNLRQLAANSMSNQGVPRNGSSLLSGLITCGQCGSRMATYYSNSGSGLRYACNQIQSTYGGASCQSLVGEPVDKFVVQQALESIKPSSLDISLQVAENFEQERKNLLAHWEKQLERARHEVDRAYRQFNAAEPENRLVVRTLEKNWEESLSAEEKLKQEYALFFNTQPTALTMVEREAIRQLSANIPALWSASTTTVKDRQEILRLLIERVIVAVESKTEKVFIEIHWSGGYKTNQIIRRTVAKLSQLSYYNDLVSRAKGLREEYKSIAAITDILNQEGFRPTKQGAIFTNVMVRSLLTSVGVKSHKKTRAQQLIMRSPDEWTIQELSQKIEVKETTLRRWVKKGELTARLDLTVSHRGIWLITADEREVKRLASLQNQPRQWIYHSRVARIN